ncbi:DnaJ-domain-containing protein [Durotheca rogersii]|uniref:DnaJ-domain-containing protein n=1 Tax=Durotheca rogersii TaxID=419775 RepID=UPI0022201FDE|nr:DnaJ-domain-containing protein [Durotheca rogersii]KAI5864832.1 DnaJ-domain-containing protein [Durotheca rogersii]
MATATHLNHYRTLEVDRAASQQELTASYRRLALIHHPDKNPDNLQEATVKFQQIQQAYDTLSDPVERSRYDARACRGSDDAFPPASQQPGYDFFDVARFYYWQDLFSNLEHNFYPFPDEQVSFAFGCSYGCGQSGFGRREQAARKEAETAREVREREEAAQKKARADARKAEEEAKAQERAKRQKREQLEQEAYWDAANALTREERVAACLHSEFCIKTTQRQKFKCSVCRVRRGLISFECPYCSLLICQQCVGQFAQRRAVALRKQKRGPDPDSEPATDAAKGQSAKGGASTKKARPNGKPKGAQGRPKET